MSVSVGRTHRLIRLLQMLQSGRKFDAGGLADGLRVSRRTLFRDLNTLEAAGVPYSYDKKTKRYSIAQDYFLPPVNLTVGEALALMLATRKVTSRKMHPDYALAVDAAMKIEAAIPGRVRRHCGAILESVAVQFWPTSDVEGVRHVIAVLHQAVLSGRKLRLRYDSYAEGEQIETVIHPYCKAFICRGWYVIGYSELHGETRTFKLERIEAATLLDAAFEPDSGFDLDSYFGNAWQMIRGDTRYHVKIRFLPLVAGNVDEVLWHKTQRTRREPDGSLIFEVDVDGIDEISWWVLGYGDQAEVLEPTSLRDIIHTRARNLTEIYQRSGGERETPPAGS